MGKPNFGALCSYQFTAATDQEAADIIEAEGSLNQAANIRDFRENNVTKFWNRTGQQVTIRKAPPTIYDLAKKYVETHDRYTSKIVNGSESEKFMGRSSCMSALDYLIEACKAEP